MRTAMLVLNDMTADARVEREAAALAEAGHDVVVFALKTPSVEHITARNGFEVRRVADYTTATWRNPAAKLAQLRSRARSMTEMVLEWQPDVVHSHDADTLVAAHKAASTLGALLVYDAHELYSDMIAEHGFGGTWPVQSYWKRVEGTLIPRADAVITVSEGLSQVLSDRHGVNSVVLRNVPRLQPLTHGNRLRTELRVLPEAKVLLYQGVLISGRGLTTLVRAMRDIPDVILAIQGFGPEESSMREAAVASGVADRVRFMGRIPQTELHDYACGADVGVVIYEATTLNNRMAAPNKLWAYRMAGLPVAASDFPGLRQAVAGDQVGHLFDPSRTDSIASTLRTMVADTEGLASMARASRALAETRDNWNVEKDILLRLYDAIGQKRKGN